MSYQNQDDAFDLYLWEREQDEQPYFEPRFYCPRHPGSVISNGMFDAPCGACESEMYDAEIEQQFEELHGGPDAAPFPAHEPTAYRRAFLARMSSDDECPF